MHNFKDILEDINKKTGISFKIIGKGGKVFYESILDEVVDLSIPININSEKFNILLNKKYEICAPLLKYTIDNRFKEIKSIKEKLINNMLSSKEVLEDDLFLNFPFLSNKCIVILVHLEGSRYDAFNIIKELYKNVDSYITIYGDDILLLKVSEDNLEHGESIKSSISSEIYSDCTVSIGKEVDNYRDIKLSYECAKKAQNLGVIFGLKSSIFNYNKLMLENIVYNINQESKDLLMNVLKHKLDNFDGEMINTIEEFLRSDLNISEAAKSLYIHRNTLIYRLDKIQKETGFDIRNFNEAIVFRIAYLVWKANN